MKFLLDAGNGLLYAPTPVDVERGDLIDFVPVPVLRDDSEEPPWEDWYRVDQLLSDVIRAGRSRHEHVMLSTEPASEFEARCLMGRSTSSGDRIFLHGRHLPPNDGVQGHDVWQSAARRGDEYVLEAPLTDEMMGAAGRLLTIALRAQGLSPLDAFLTYLRSG
ncbi:hypothetical protein KRR39_05405 [Nocardioides panacis]|uniref:Uncharacterized protein n=1 Tax=Nocardioides panacis TaxID=2849501 RepID=A0A975T0B2_9ACTN|nr:hypothetical protein [Nocardioides panacis]QWZ09227.1 hypothetical protein KRR39_05405 [Nocardioides panacis]